MRRPTDGVPDGFDEIAQTREDSKATKKSAQHRSKEGVFLTLRWLKEFDEKNRLEGDPLMLNVSLTF